MKRILSIAAVLLAAGHATAATPTNQIDALTQRLNEDKFGLWTNGGSPIIPLSSNATPQEVVACAVKMWGFNPGRIKTYKIREVRTVHLNAVGKEHCSAALVESDLGAKVLLFNYGGEKTGWWTRFYDVKDEGPNQAPENIGTNAPNYQH